MDHEGRLPAPIRSALRERGRAGRRGVQSRSLQGGGTIHERGTASGVARQQKGHQLTDRSRAENACSTCREYSSARRSTGLRADVTPKAKVHSLHRKGASGAPERAWEWHQHRWVTDTVTIEQAWHE